MNPCLLGVGLCRQEYQWYVGWLPASKDCELARKPRAKTSTMSFCLPFFRTSSAAREFEEDNRTDYLEKHALDPPSDSPVCQGGLLKNEARERLYSLRALMQDNKVDY